MRELTGAGAAWAAADASRSSSGAEILRAKDMTRTMPAVGATVPTGARIFSDLFLRGLNHVGEMTEDLLDFVRARSAEAPTLDDVIGKVMQVHVRPFAAMLGKDLRRLIVAPERGVGRGKGIGRPRHRHDLARGQRSRARLLIFSAPELHRRKMRHRHPALGARWCKRANAPRKVCDVGIGIRRAFSTHEIEIDRSDGMIGLKLEDALEHCAGPVAI